ncbi:VOC family protein [Streptomyces sp. NPDC050619]|uniref:VOC family protein n=1 Tax=Streptomyces sp. NPDC050619 TaxID=3157214 RepID=UPI0034373D1C
MPDLLGINHLTLSTTDLDRLVTYYTELLGARPAFERAATSSDPRIAVIDVGGDDHLMIVETPTTPTTPPTDLDPLRRAGWGLRTMTARDPDGRSVDVRAHRPRTASPAPTAG